MPEKIKGNVLSSFFLLSLSSYNLMDIEIYAMGGSKSGGREDMFLRWSGAN